jgi:hypothetical protein
MDLSKVYDPDNPDNCDRNRTELDSHADTCVAGSNMAPLWYTDHCVSGSQFIGEYKPLEDIPIAIVATAWDNPKDGSTVILVLNEMLYFGSRMSYSLICPNQLRHNGIIVDDVPKAFDPTSTQSIVIPDALTLPLKMRGVLSYLPTRKPTDKELQECVRYELTSPNPWNPYEITFNPDGDRGPYVISFLESKMIPSNCLMI